MEVDWIPGLAGSPRLFASRTAPRAPITIGERKTTLLGAFSLSIGAIEHIVELNFERERRDLVFHCKASARRRRRDTIDPVWIGRHRHTHSSKLRLARQADPTAM